MVLGQRIDSGCVSAFLLSLGSLWANCRLSNFAADNIQHKRSVDEMPHFIERFAQIIWTSFELARQDIVYCKKIYLSELTNDIKWIPWLDLQDLKTLLK